MLRAMRRSATRRALGAGLAGIALCAPAAAASDAALRFARDGEVVATLGLDAFEASAACNAHEVELDDPYHLRRKTYRACPLREVLVAGFGEGVLAASDANFFLRARDGYAKPASGARLLETGGFVAFADLSNPAGDGWEPIDRRAVDPAPFYLVWAEEGQQDFHRYPWPYQLVTIDMAPFEGEYPHTLPRGVPDGQAAWRGFAIFRAECVACHAINGEGGSVGPELNVPRSIVEYRPADQIREYVRDPRRFRYTSMPPHLHLGDDDLDALIAYFRAMSQRKRDPGDAPGG
jgi:mono/diheme cytochrome c family protein